MCREDVSSLCEEMIWHLERKILLLQPYFLSEFVFIFVERIAMPCITEDYEESGYIFFSLVGKTIIVLPVSAHRQCWFALITFFYNTNEILIGS